MNKNIQLYLGDNKKILKQIDLSMVDLVITDPPYNQKYKYNLYKDNLTEKKYLELLSVIIPPCVMIHYPEETLNLFPKLFGRVAQVVSWVYNSNTGKQHRLISWWDCQPDFRKVRQPYKNLKDKRIIERIKRGKVGAKLYDWWEIQQVKNVSREKTGHPCQIPEKVIENIILTTTSENDTILDPFMGSGTTAVVCKRFNHNFIGIEISKEYLRIAIARIKAYNKEVKQ